MFGRIFCLSLLLITTHAFASDRHADSERQCKRIREKEPTYDIPFSEAMTAYVQVGILKAAKEYDGAPDPDVDNELMTRIIELGKPQYRPYLDQGLNTAQTKFQRAINHLKDRAPKMTTDQMDASGVCYIREMLSDPNSIAHAEAVKIMDDITMSADFDISRKEERVKAQKYVENVRMMENARKQSEIAKARSEEEHRQNPSSNTAKVGSFTVTANSCTSSSNIGFGKPRSQPGSKFLILDATFKNTSGTSQRIEPGALLVNHEGKTYTYDIIEFILDAGYGLPAGPINPLISYRAKLVYRIPNELSGKVRWQPGNNLHRATVQCGSI